MLLGLQKLPNAVSCIDHKLWLLRLQFATALSGAMRDRIHWFAGDHVQRVNSNQQSLVLSVQYRIQLHQCTGDCEIYFSTCVCESFICRQQIRHLHRQHQCLDES
jgi:hypothetical protein